MSAVEQIQNVKKVRKFLPNAVSTKVARQLLVARKNSPTILFSAGVIGVVGTTVLACRATLKVDDVLDEANEKLEKAKALRESDHPDYSEKDYNKDVAFIYIRSAVRFTKLFGPAFVLGVTSIGALAGAHNILSKRNMALTAAYAAVEKGFSEYRERVVAEFGEDKDRELRYSTESKTIVEEKKNGEMKKVNVKRVGPAGSSIYAKFFDETNQSWSPTPEYNRIFLQAKQNYANDMLHARGHVFLNEVYDSLGLERTQAGAVVGWVLSKDGDNYIDFGIFTRPENDKVRDFVNGLNGAILLDFNVDGTIFDKI